MDFKLNQIHPFTDPPPHSTVRAEKDLKDHQAPTPCRVQGHLPLQQVAQMLNISLLSKISGGLTITFVSANQRWGSFSTVGVRDIAYGKAGDKETDIKWELDIEQRKSFLLTEESLKKYIFYQGRLSLVLDFSEYKYLSIKFLLADPSCISNFLK